jgi:tripartite ATP-independent transporter DctM subunit
MLLVALLLLLFFLGIGVPVAAGLLLLSLALGALYSAYPLHVAFGEIAWTSSTDTLLVAIPLFVLLGEIFLRSGIAERMYAALAQWLSWLPGGLMHSNIGVCALFSATSGSSVATAATVSTVALPQMRRYGYNERLFLGTLTSGGTLGILIPPSINLILYGALAGVSVPGLYLAAILPGFLLAALFSLAVVGICLFRPEMDGTRQTSSWEGRIRSLPHLLPPVFIFAVVIGTIYAGIATPTESASIGVLAALVLAAVYRRLTVSMLRVCFQDTVRVTAMIMLIVVAAYILNFVLSSIGMVATLSSLVSNLGVSPLFALLVIVGIYIILGCFMDTLTMMIATIPIVVPVIVALGYDPLWFGIVLIILVEMALITPPVGMNLYVVQSVRGGGSISDVMIGSLPFVAVMLAMIALLIIFPGMVLL